MQSDLASKTKRPSNQPRLFLTPSEMLSPFYVLHNITGTNAVIQFKSILRPQTCKHKCLQWLFTWYLNSTPFPCPAKNGMASDLALPSGQRHHYEQPSLSFNTPQMLQSESLEFLSCPLSTIPHIQTNDKLSMLSYWFCLQNTSWIGWLFARPPSISPMI